METAPLNVTESLRQLERLADNFRRELLRIERSGVSSDRYSEYVNECASRVGGALGYAYLLQEMQD